MAETSGVVCTMSCPGKNDQISLSNCSIGVDTFIGDLCTCADMPVYKGLACLQTLCTGDELDSLVQAETARCGADSGFLSSTSSARQTRSSTSSFISSSIASSSSGSIQPSSLSTQSSLVSTQSSSVLTQPSSVSTQPSSGAQLSGGTHKPAALVIALPIAATAIVVAAIICLCRYTARRRARSAGRSSETRSPSITRFYGYPSPIASSVHKGESGFLASSAPSPTSPVQEAAFVPSPPGLPNRTPADTAAAQPSGEAGAHTGPAPSYPASAATAADGSPPIVIASGAETSADPRSQVIVLPWPMGERLLALLSSTSLPGTAARPGGELGAPAHGESEYLPAYEEREGPPAAVGGPFSRGPVRASPRLETRGTKSRASANVRHVL